ncbi:MAG: YggT family protein [Enterobacteriaceae bacterium]
MSFAAFIIDTVLSLLVLLLLLRVWMQIARADFYNPFAQFVVRLTQPVTGPVRRILPSIGSLDTASLLLAYVLVIAKFILLYWLQNGFLLLDPILLLGAVIVLIKMVGKLAFWVLLLRALMSWVSQGRSPVEYALMQLTEPFLSVIRRFLPNTGGLDFSVMIAMFILMALNYLGTDLTAMINMAGFWITG